MRPRAFLELSSKLRWFLTAMILANIAGQMVFVVLPLYLVQLGAGVVQVGLTLSLAALVPLLLQILGGWVSDSIGRLRTIAVGALCASLGYLGMAIAPSWQWAMFALCLEFISGSLVGPSFSAFVAEQTAEERPGHGLWPVASHLPDRGRDRSRAWGCACLPFWIPGAAARGIRFGPAGASKSARSCIAASDGSRYTTAGPSSPQRRGCVGIRA